MSDDIINNLDDTTVLYTLHYVPQDSKSYKTITVGALKRIIEDQIIVEMDLKKSKLTEDARGDLEMNIESRLHKVALGGLFNDLKAKTLMKKIVKDLSSRRGAWAYMYEEGTIGIGFSKEEVQIAVALAEFNGN